MMDFEKMMNFYECKKYITRSNEYGSTEKVHYNDPNGQETNKEDNVYFRKIINYENHDVIKLFSLKDNLNLKYLNDIKGADLGKIDNFSRTVMICEYLQEYEPLEAKYKTAHKDKQYNTDSNIDRSKIKYSYAMLKKDKLDLKKIESMVCDLALDVCDGLMELHKMKFLHLDIKPENIMVYCPNNNGQPINYKKSDDKPLKIIDYGNVWQFTGKESVDKQHNMERQSLVSRGFSAPEIVPAQFGYGIPGKYSDIYSVGALMKALLPDDYLTIDHFVRPRLQSVIEKAMEMDPEDRYQDISELKEAIILAKKPYPTRMWNSFKKWILGAAGLFLLWSIVIGLGPYLYYTGHVIPQLEEQLRVTETKLDNYRTSYQFLDNDAKSKIQTLEKENNELKNTLHSDDLSITTMNADGTNNWNFRVAKEGETNPNQEFSLQISTLESSKELKDLSVTLEYIDLGLKSKKVNGIVQRDGADLDNSGLCHKISQKYVFGYSDVRVNVLNSDEDFVVEGEKPTVQVVINASNLKKPIVQRIPIEIIK